jgi:uncharacterized protein YidB (DUF937 family)
MTVNIPSTVASAVVSSGGTSGVARRHGHGSVEKTLQAVADQLKMSPDDLTKQLAGGTSLTDIAQAHGVGKADLVTTIASTLPTTAPDGSTIDTTAMATRIADTTRQAPPRRSGGSGPESDLGKGIDSLANALGVSSADLLTRLTNGTGIGDLLTANPDVSAQLAQLQNKGSLVDGYA